MKVLIAITNDVCLESIEEAIVNYDWPPKTHFLILTVVAPIEGCATLLPPVVCDAMLDDDRKKAQEFVRRVALKIRDTFKSPYVSEKIIEGSPKTEIAAVAKEWGAELIVVGCRHKPQLDLDQFMKGSVSEAVLKSATSSIYIVRPAKAAKSQKSAPELVRDKW